MHPLLPNTSGDSPDRHAAVVVVRTLQTAGHLAYFAGGCVRDELLGLTPSDYDVATDATPDRITSLFRRTAAVGASFGVMLVKEAQSIVEVATFRADGTYLDNRRPDSVRFSTPKEDACRRDFTVNALFLDPLDLAAGPGGRVIDHVGGREDLERRVIQAVGDPDQRLAEDHLRALRAVRLSAKLGFTIAPPTAQAISRHAGDLKGVSRERIGDEIRRMLGHHTRAVAIGLLHDLGLDEAVLDTPGPSASRSTSRLARLDRIAPLGLALAAWARDRGATTDPQGVKEVTLNWRRALCLSNEEQGALTGVLTILHALTHSWSAMGVAARKRLLARAQATEALALLHLESPEHGRAVQEGVAQLVGDGVGLWPEPLVSGDDLIAAGWEPGPQFRMVLDRVYDAQLEGIVHEKSAALELAARVRV